MSALLFVTSSPAPAVGRHRPLTPVEGTLPESGVCWHWPLPCFCLTLGFSWVLWIFPSFYQSHWFRCSTKKINRYCLELKLVIYIHIYTHTHKYKWIIYITYTYCIIFISVWMYEIYNYVYKYIIYISTSVFRKGWNSG